MLLILLSRPELDLVELDEAYRIGKEGSELVAEGGREQVLLDTNNLRSLIELRLLDEIFLSIFISLSEEGLSDFAC